MNNATLQKSFVDNADNLIQEYSILVKKIAHHLAGKLPASVQSEDLVQAGMIGLIEASNNYDATKGASFETYAGIRIRGSMLDEIRKGDWVPRSVHRNSRLIADTVRKLEQDLNRCVKDIDVAQALGINLGEYYKILKDITSSRILGYEELGVSEEIFSKGLHGDSREPLAELLDNGCRHFLARQIENLPERERLVLKMYYEEELNLREIGKVLGITESRVCQIHGQALIKLQAKMQTWFDKTL